MRLRIKHISSPDVFVREDTDTSCNNHSVREPTECEESDNNGVEQGAEPAEVPEEAASAGERAEPTGSHELERLALAEREEEAAVEAGGEQPAAGDREKEEMAYFEGAET